MMNDKIRELAEQAGYIDKGSNHTTYRDFNHEKFAELIISECIGVAEREDTDVMMKEGYPCSQTAKKIREHFGVK